jgi:5'-nucleotidase
MHILVTNDDGVEAPGLLALAAALRPLGKITVLAPDRNWSASGHVKTMHRPLRVKPTTLADGSAALASDGAPSDCVALALLGLVPEPIDLVVSGINPNANVGHDVTYSGTVTAAMEATIAGIPGLAVSLDTPEEHKASIDYEPSAHLAAHIIKSLVHYTLPKPFLLNINFPYGPVDTMRGVAITRQGLRVYRDALVERADPRGRPYYWIGGEAPTGVPDQGTDFWALSERLVSITPLQLDLTAHDQLEVLKSWDLHL